MYRAKNGFTLLDNSTRHGWKIERAEDIITALLAYPIFATVDTGILWAAIGEATEARKEYANIEEFAEYMACNYI